MIDLFCCKACHLGPVTPVSPPGLHAEMVAVMTDLSLIVLIVANTNQGNAGSVQRMMRSVHSVNNGYTCIMFRTRRIDLIRNQLIFQLFSDRQPVQQLISN